MKLFGWRLAFTSMLVLPVFRLTRPVAVLDDFAATADERSFRISASGASEDLVVDEFLLNGGEKIFG